MRNLEAVGPLLRLRVYPEKWASGRKFVGTGARSPLADALMFDLPGVAAIVPPGSDETWKAPASALIDRAITQSIQAARPTQHTVQLTPEIDVLCLDSANDQSIYLSALLMDPARLAKDRGHGLLVAAPAANIVLIRALARDRALELTLFVALARRIFEAPEVSELALSADVWSIHGTEAERITSAPGAGSSLPTPILSAELGARLGLIRPPRPWWKFW